MYGNLILPIFISLLVLINGQHDEERDFASDIEINQVGRSSKSSFDAKFHRGQCPDRFYQLGDECLFFATDGKIYSWHQAQRLCARRTGRLLERQSFFGIGKPNQRPTNNVRQLILNTPEKTKILEALYRDYEELNYAVRLPSDYNTLHRCHDGKEDHWPQYCSNPDGSNVTCFETTELSSNNICLRQTDCHKHYSRLACEFTLPGKPEITASKFRHCPKVRGLRHRLPIWAWILIVVGAMLLLLLILGVVLAFIRKTKNGSSPIKKPIPEQRTLSDQVSNVSSTHRDPSAEPMLVSTSPANISDTGYLEPQPLNRIIPPTGKHDATSSNV